MYPHTRAMVAAAAYALITGRKVAGIYDHAAAADRQIAAESSVCNLQGFDGDRSAKFGGTLPELYDAGDKAFVSFEIVGAKAQGYDRASGSAYVAQVNGLVVQVFDHGQNAWFAFEVRGEEPAAPTGEAAGVAG